MLGSLDTEIRGDSVELPLIHFPQKHLQRAMQYLLKTATGYKMRAICSQQLTFDDGWLKATTSPVASFSDFKVSEFKNIRRKIRCVS